MKTSILEFPLALKFTLIYATRSIPSLKDEEARESKIEEIDRSRLTSVFEQEGDCSRFVILSIPVGTTSWKGAIALPFGNIRILILILMVIHTCLADLLLKAFKRLFQSLTYLEE